MTRLCTDLSRMIRLTVAVAALSLAAVYPSTGIAASDDPKSDPVNIEQASSPVRPVHITWGKADVIDIGADVADIMVARPDIADVTVIKQNKIYIVGQGIGDTNVIVLDSKGDVLKKLDVHVQYDTKAIQQLVDETFPNEHAKVEAVHDQIYLTGTVSTPVVASKITNMVGHYVSDLQDKNDPIDQLVSNFLEVSGEQQVMLRVKIVEVSRSILKELGVETQANDPNETSSTTVFGRTPPSSVQSVINSAAVATNTTGLTEDPFAVGTFIKNTGIAGIGYMELLINVLEKEGLVNVLAEPNLTSVSGEQAGFLAGGEFPVPVGRDQIGNIVVEFKQFGVSLNFRPRVMSPERISLQLNTEVSSLDQDNSITLADVSVPGLDVRRADTTVEIPSGGSLMIAGLLKSEALDSMSGLPGIRNTPILGKLISSQSFQREETELVVIVTPYMVEPYADKTNAQEKPKEETNPLAQAFATNVRRIYGDSEDDLFKGDVRYGYLLN